MIAKIDDVKLEKEALFEHATRFVYDIGYLGEVSIRLRTDDVYNGKPYRRWSILNIGYCWDDEERKFIHDIPAANRTEDYMKRTEFPLHLAISILMYIKRIVIDATEEGKNEPFEVSRLIGNELF